MRKASSPIQPVAHGKLSPALRDGHNIDFSMAQLASSELAREINRDVVLDFIRFRQPISRVDLSRLCGLQPSTVSAIVKKLMEEKWVKEGAVVRGTPGRPSTMLLVNEDMVTLAVDIRPGSAILAVIDIRGRFLSHETIVTVADPKLACAKIVARIRHLRDQHAGKLFEGIGVTVPGRVDPVTQRLIMAPNLKWHGFDIKSTLEKGTGLQVEIDNDANACLLSEIWYGRLEGVRNAVLIAVSEGIGAAILAGGQIQSGFNGLAGEFGHIPIDPSGPLCGCGQNGCWEVFASSRAALHYYHKLVPKSPVRHIRDLLHLAEENDSAAVQALSEQAKFLGRGLRLITAALAPELILLTGEITSCWDKVGPIIQKELAGSMLAGDPPRLAPAGDGYLARLSGGAAVLLKRHSRYYHSTHASRGRKPTATRRTPRREPYKGNVFLTNLIA